MSETTSYALEDMQPEQVVDKAAQPDEVMTDNWDTELTALVAQNADVLVRPSWMSVEVPLSAAMYNIIITRQNVDVLVAEIYRLLTTREEEVKEPEEPSQTANELAENQEPVDKENQRTLHVKEKAAQVNKRISEKATEEEAYPRPLHETKMPISLPVQKIGKNEARQESPTKETGQTIEKLATEPMLQPEFAGQDPVAASSEQFEVAVQEEGVAAQDLVIESPIYEPTKFEVPHEEHQPAQLTELEINEKISIDELQTFSLDLPQQEETQAGPDLLSQPIESAPAALFDTKLENDEYLEPATDLELSTLEAEPFFSLLAERVEIAEPKIVELVDRIISEIVEFSEQVPATSFEDAEDIKEELEEKLIRLFEVAEMAYTHELITAIVNEVLGRRIDIETFVQENKETQILMQGRGTHEAIRQLMGSMSSLNKSMAQACAIGRTTMHLYVSDLSKAA